MNFKKCFIGYKGRKKYPDNAPVVATGNVSNITYATYTGGGSSDTGSTGTTTDAYTKAETNALLAAKQDTLVSGDNIKTINGESLVGGGDIEIDTSKVVITPIASDLFDYQYIGAHAGIGEKEVATVNDGTNTFYLTSIDREAYKICLFKQTAHIDASKYPIIGLPQDLVVKFENYDTRLLGNTKYRLCLMEWRKDKDKCWHWSIPMITPRWDKVTGAITHEYTPSRYTFEETFTPISGQATKMFGNITGKTWADILPLDTVTYDYVSETRYRFRNGRSNRIFGFALFRLFEPDSEGYVGSYEWARVSNIVKFKVTVNKNGRLKARVLP